jgi:hypothetical protein
MATVMPGVMKKRSPTKRSGECIMLPVTEDLRTSGPKVLEVHIEEPKEMPLELADVVVAGGWGSGTGKAGFFWKTWPRCCAVPWAPLVRRWMRVGYRRIV